MTVTVAFRSLLVWVVILLLAILNGIFRAAVLLPWLGVPWGMLLSGALLSVIIFSAAYLTLPWLGTRRVASLWGIGLGWLALTLIFEIAIGRWQGMSWSVMLEAYTFKDGNIWPLVLLVVAVAPVMAAKIRGWTQRA
ncbi:hypothetical protein [Rheinheimera sp. 4Y26]|uniref:hypothetical protein n=1 Tax=Rheinheimera sp. 4Y26 TaxID=2977811 RepID=UPI0021B0A191|nr:hypothetical protein [Rheinheimera sp. 4Y26]MCT6699983.1 hypothetical protein [Rheinheimera sp. 4Y26]